MSPLYKKILLLSVGLLAAGGVVYAVTRKKTPPPAPKKRTAVAYAGDTQTVNESGVEVLKMGEEGEAVTRLQFMLNQYHDLRVHLRDVCRRAGTKVFMGFPAKDGKLIAESGNFDYPTKEALLFYFGKGEIAPREVEQAQMMIEKWLAADDGYKCEGDPVLGASAFTNLFNPLKLFS